MTTRVLVVDDSASMRAMIGQLLSRDPEIEVVGSAAEPNEARAMIKALSPDVVTLDVEMPGMDGLTFLERIMRLRPMPVVMCSTLTARGAQVTIEALRLGAVDCIAKPSGRAADLADHADKLCRTVREAARSKVRGSAPSPRPPALGGALRSDMLILVGASTGGVEALFAFLGGLPANAPPVVVVQHMPAAFTGGFADRLNASVPMRVRHGSDRQPLVPGEVVIAPGGDTHAEVVTAGALQLRLVAGELHGGHRPSVDRLFESATELRSRAVGVLLTGMGRDGADGLLKLRNAGAATFAQSADSCVVYGMPRAATEIGAAQREVAISRMAEAVLGACKVQGGRK